ncbi:MAG: hypothetical protein FJ314_08530 [SAR202 cluster bacterium]|nr:hypothetical protein [SAR202 cluster bacterium]
MSLDSLRLAVSWSGNRGQVSAAGECGTPAVYPAANPTLRQVVILPTGGIVSSGGTFQYTAFACSTDNIEITSGISSVTWSVTGGVGLLEHHGYDSGDGCVLQEEDFRVGDGYRQRRCCRGHADPDPCVHRCDAGASEAIAALPSALYRVSPIRAGSKVVEVNLVDSTGAKLSGALKLPATIEVQDTGGSPGRWWRRQPENPWIRH